MQPTIQQRAAKQALGVLRSCGVGPGSEEQAVKRMLNAYLRTLGKRATPTGSALRELLIKYTEQPQTVGLYGWLIRMSMG